MSTSAVCQQFCVNTCSVSAVHMNSEKAEETQVTVCQLRGALNPAAPCQHLEYVSLEWQLTQQLCVNTCSVSAALCQHLQCVSSSVPTPAVCQLRAGMNPSLCKHLQCDSSSVSTPAACQLRAGINPAALSAPAVCRLRAGINPAALCQHLQCVGLELE